MLRFLSLFLVAGLAFSACQSSSAQNAAGLISPRDFNARADKAEFLLLDVRTMEEWNEGHLEGAVRIDKYSPDFEEQLKKLDRSKPTLVYCAAGGRSADAAVLLKDMGFTQVLDLDGGMRAWQSAGLPIAK